MLIKIIIAISLGLLIGAEREKTGKVIGSVYVSCERDSDEIDAFSHRLFASS